MWDAELSAGDLRLRELILKKEILDAEALDQVLEQRREKLREARSLLKGKLLCLEGSKLQIMRMPEQTLLSEIQLETQAVRPAAATAELILIEPDEGRYAARFAPAAESGLVAGAEFPYLYWPQLESSARIGLSDSRLDPGKSGLDLFLSPQQELLVVADRRQGCVTLVSMISHRRLGKVQIRPSGSSKALNVAIEPGGKRVFLTDNQSGTLYILEVDRLRVVELHTGLGPLGNLLIGPDPQYLYLVTLQPGLELRYFDLESFTVIKDLDIKGKAFSQLGSMPTDLLSMTADGRYVLLLTYLDEPDPQTPVVNVIDADSVRTVRRYAIKDGARPWMLATAWENPLAQAQELQLSHLLQDAGLIEEAALSALQAELGRQDVSYAPYAESEDLQDLLDREAPPIQLSAEADEAIIELLVRAFYQEQLTNLRVHPSELRRLRQHALEIRQELENRYAADVSIPGLLGRYTLHTLISREAVLKLMQQQELEAPFRPRERCPMCREPIAAEQPCAACGFCYGPADDGRASAEIHSQGVAGQFLLSLPARAKVLLMNYWQHILWELDTEHLTEPVHAIALPSQNLLVCDRHYGRVLEFTPGGNLVWQSAVALKEPQMATYYLHEGEERLLVAETGSGRVVEFSRRQALIRSYGDGAGHVKLAAPWDVQRTAGGSWLISDRGGQVVEVDEEGEVLLRFGAELGLREPVFARRLNDQRIVIVDAGRAEVIVLVDGIVRESVSYWPPLTKANFFAREAAPDRVLMLHGQELLLIGRSGYLQFSLPLMRTRWVESLPYARPGHRLTRVVETGPAAPVAEHGYLSLLRRIRFLADADRHTLEALLNYLKPMSCKAGEWVMRQAEPAMAMYFVLSGEVEILKEQAGTCSSVARIQAGDMFGEMALLVGGMRTSSARALRDCHLLQLERADFRQVMTRFPALAGKIRALAQERRAMSHSVQSSRKLEVMNRLKIQLALKKIKQLPFLQGAGSDFYEILASQLQPVAFLPGKKVFQRGESGDSMYFISRGQVEILPQDDAAPVAVLDEGEIFGEMALILDQERSASVRTLVYCQLLALDRDAFEEVALQFPDFYQRLKQLAMGRQEINSQTESRAPASDHLPPEQRPRLEIRQAEGFESQRLIYFLSQRQEKVFGLDAAGAISWVYGFQSERQLFYPSRCQVGPEGLLVADSGNDRILEIGYDRQVLREWGPEHHVLLQHPRSAVRTPDGGVLIADEGNQRLLWIGPAGDIVWEYSRPNEILSPAHAEVTPQGTILFADSAMHQVQEVDRQGKLLWGFGHLFLPGDGPDELCEPSFVQQLPDGPILIADTGNHRVLKLDRDGKIERVYRSLPGYPLENPQHCEALPDGSLLVYSSEPETITRYGPDGEPRWQCHVQPPAAVLAEV